MHKKPVPTQPVAKIIVYLFPSPDGQWGHWIRVEGQLSPAQAMHLAIRALRQRLTRRIW